VIAIDGGGCRVAKTRSSGKLSKAQLAAAGSLIEAAAKEAKAVVEPAEKARAYLSLANAQTKVGDTAAALLSIETAKKIAAETETSSSRKAAAGFLVYLASTQADAGDANGAEASVPKIETKVKP
jgi:hypothetical protein